LGDYSYYVYVIELDPEAKDRPQWSAQNPDQTTEQCFYVGQSSHEPECRFAQHAAPRRSEFLCRCSSRPGSVVNAYQIGRAQFARDLALRLRPDLYEEMNPLDSQDEAKQAEASLAALLRDQGHGAWSN